MGSSVDANSLSEITQLASNPPKYPRNSTEQKRDPLTLYIARVPGSRDIILTTLKPQLKNVTAEDVAASLYLLHLNTEDDLNLLGDFVAEENITPQEKPLPRNPLPGSARSSLDGQRIGNPAIQDVTTVFLKRKPITGLVPTHAQKVYLPAETLPRKPLGPRPQVQEPALDRKPLPGFENTRQILSSQDPNLAPSSQISADDAHSFQAHESLSGSAATRKYSAKDFSITIIRRDLSSGAQWNVGSIAGQPIAETTGESRDGSTRRSRKPYFDMLIDLTNPGYTYFRDQTRGHTNLHQKSRSDSEVFKQQTQMTFDESFHREIHMEGSSFWGRSSMQHRRTRSNLSDVSSRGLSLSNTKAGDSSGRSPRNSGENSDRVGGSETKGYIFYSPWDGPCKFTTGSGGRSLRCTHTLPAAVSATMGDGKPPQESVPVSELRFNLPSSAVFKPSGTAGTKGKASAGTHRFHIPKFGNIRNKLSPSKVHGTHQPQLDPTSYSAMYPSDDESGPPLPLRPKPIQQASTHTVKADLLQQAQIYRSHLEDESDSRLDLSIGKEKAGGGNRGKRAKLGKLIIYDEGFKMLDLIVGANMSVWWSVWETDK